MMKKYMAFYFPISIVFKGILSMFIILFSVVMYEMAFYFDVIVMNEEAHCLIIAFKVIFNIITFLARTAPAKE